MTDDLRYPIGRYSPPERITDGDRAGWIDQVAALPAELRAAFGRLSPEERATPYRDGGWTANQVVHHVADSHLNAVVRFKLALTEDLPTIKPYREDAWADLPDVATVPPEVSLDLLDALHTRWVAVLRAMAPSDFERALFHPERGAAVSLGWMLGLYAWHGRHHLGHVQGVPGRRGG